MGETKTEKASKTSWFTGLKAEFDKIIWPDKKSLTRQTAAVVRSEERRVGKEC